MTERPTQPHRELLLEVELSNASPRIWRRLIVSESLTLADLHQVLQIAMGGWLDYHLYEFRFSGRCFTTLDEDAPPESIDSASVTLRDLGLDAVGANLSYLYDFGDDWEHSISVVAVEPAEGRSSYPRCIEGERSGPPEDCGGPYRYEEILDIIKNEAHPEFRELTEWLPRGFDPAKFDLGVVNSRLDEHFRIQVN